MITFDKFDANLDVNFQNTYIGDKWYNLGIVPCGFDIETTGPFMYIWTLTIYDETIVGCTWEDLKLVLNKIKEKLELGKVEKKANKAIPVFVHNLGGFEWHFIKSELNITEKFIVKDCALFCEVDDSFVFVDSYKICPMSLDKLAKTYCKTQKTHDLDYSIPRNHTDAKNLTEEELTYCCNDTKILAEYAVYVFNNYVIPYKRLPLTQNQIVKMVISYNFEQNRNENKAFLDHKFINKKDYYLIRKYGFRGGFCQSSERDEKGSIKCADLDAAYSSAVLTRYFPIGRYTTGNKFEWKQYLDKYCCQILIRFTNVHTKDMRLKLETKEHVICETVQDRKNIETDKAGRIISAPKFIVSLNELEYELFCKCYYFEKEELIKIRICERGPLPKYVKDAVIHFYEPKAYLKKRGKEHTAEYKQVKTMPSTIFGAMAQRVYKKDLELNNYDWYTKFSGKKLLPQWGVYVAAHVRYAIINMILTIGIENWLYSDTDSIYYLSTPEIDDIFKEYNRKQRLLNLRLCKKYELDFNLFNDLGTFDFGKRNNLVIDRFKTIGSKTYIYHYTDNDNPNGNYKIIISGIPVKFFEQSYEEYLAKGGKKDKISYFEPNIIIRYVRNVSEIIDKPIKAVINGEEMICNSGVKITPETITGPMRDIKNKLAYERLEENMNDDLEYNNE